MKFTPETLLTPGAVSKLTGLAENTLSQWRCLGQGPAFYKLGNKVRYHVDDFNSWMEEQRRTTSQASRPTATRPPAAPKIDKARRHKLGGHKTKAEKQAEREAGLAPKM